MNVVGVIPARYKSSRFPGKPLADIHGKPMIWWVYKNAIQVTEFKNKVYVATDDERIVSACRNLNMNVIQTSDTHPTGTDRVAEVGEKIKADLYINIQGDEPLVKKTTIQQAILPFQDKKKKIIVTNLMSRIIDMTDLVNTTVPKVVVNKKNEAIFLSRLPIPYPKTKEKIIYYKQLGIYGFSSDALRQFHISERGAIEKIEDIELLRFIEHKIPVQMIEVNQREVMAVDTPSDLEAVRIVLQKRKKIM